MKQRIAPAAAPRHAASWADGGVLDVVARDSVSATVRTASPLKELLAGGVLVGFLVGFVAGVNLPRAPTSQPSRVAAEASDAVFTAAVVVVPASSVDETTTVGLSTSPTCAQFCATPEPGDLSTSPTCAQFCATPEPGDLSTSPTCAQYCATPSPSPTPRPSPTSPTPRPQSNRTPYGDGFRSSPASAR